MSGDWDTVLVVDDDPACRDLHSIWLEDEYEVLTAADGKAAIELVGQADVMLLDREMPRMDGEAVAHHVHETEQNCFVVMLSGVEPDFDILDLPVDEYLTKPVSQETVLKTVETMVSRGVCQQMLREYFSLTARKATLELRKRPDELTNSEEYHELLADREAKRVALNEMLEQFDGDWRQAILAAVGDETTASEATQMT